MPTCVRSLTRSRSNAPDSLAGLANAGAKLDQISPILEIKEKELESLTSLLTTASLPSPGMTTGDPDSIADSLQPLLPEVLGLASQAMAANVVLARLTDALGDETGEGRAHDFKSASFTVPTKCRVCEGSIWGLTKQGKSCRNCGVVVHSKCELKVRSRPTRQTERDGTDFQGPTSDSWQLCAGVRVRRGHPPTFGRIDDFSCTVNGVRRQLARATVDTRLERSSQRIRRRARGEQRRR